MTQEGRRQYRRRGASEGGKQATITGDDTDLIICVEQLNDLDEFSYDLFVRFVFLALLECQARHHTIEYFVIEAFR